MNTMVFEGEVVNIGPTPSVLSYIGFKDREEVESAAVKYSQGKPFMRTDDVVDYFKKLY